ncbi:MAG TPA: D-glycero-beta-D-manno-heptose-7-phosphate kinase [Candidatus Binatia bacterium]|jgi:rfaE bifunctional protein kinase chain/domain|nr:D-glycero-beta-D-manno-heptose-7-phosphate kinase [Candidatus Binatia bacterium]
MTRVVDILEKFRAAHLLVVGDLMLDRFIWGDVERISPEAPVPVMRVLAESHRLGGAANVINNVLSLGAQVTACGVIGRDMAGRRLVHDLRRAGASTAGIVGDKQVQTTQKSRIIARPRHQQIVRLDRENQNPISDATLKRLREFVLARAKTCDGIVISDYGKGVVHGSLLRSIAPLVRRKKLIFVVDPKKENYAGYQFPTLITPNKDEASEASGILIRDDASLIAAGEKLVRMWQAEAVLITRGPDGMSLFRRNHAVKNFPTEPRDMFDVTGAGDTVVAVCGLALVCGASFEEAAVISNLAAGLVGEEVGTVAVSLDKLKRSVRDKQL